VTTTGQPADAAAAEWLDRARQGDAQAFCRLAAAHEERLFRHAVALCRDPALAEDLAAETLVQAWRSLGRFNAQCQFSTWLYAILLHRYQKAVRRARREPVPISSLAPAEAGTVAERLDCLPDPQPPPAEAAQAAEQARTVRAAVAALPAIHQEVLCLRFFEGASLPEIAAALGLPLGTIKSRLHHALEKLRAEWRDT
jgi:RNA polymerase sigma-70 factor (ECF subfamily)